MAEKRNIFLFGDPHHGQPNATTFTTKGAQQASFTWSEAPGSFDTALDLTDPDSFQGIMPVLSLNGTDEEADSPDAAFWSHGDGATDSAFSLAAWVKASDFGAVRHILTKWDETTASQLREWKWYLEADERITFAIYDESLNVQPNRTTDTGITFDQWQHLALTYDGTGGATSMTGVTMYLNGAVQASTGAEAGTYVAMEAQATPVNLGFKIGTGGTLALPFDGVLAGAALAPLHTSKELSVNDVKALYDLGRAALGL